MTQRDGTGREVGRVLSLFPPETSVSYPQMDQKFLFKNHIFKKVLFLLSLTFVDLSNTVPSNKSLIKALFFATSNKILIIQMKRLSSKPGEDRKSVV